VIRGFLLTAKHFVVIGQTHQGNDIYLYDLDTAALRRVTADGLQSEIPADA
jgi:beta-glucosidase-like glycosyl hydrolase